MNNMNNMKFCLTIDFYGQKYLNLESRSTHIFKKLIGLRLETYISSKRYK